MDLPELILLSKTCTSPGLRLRLTPRELPRREVLGHTLKRNKCLLPLWFYPVGQGTVGRLKRISPIF